MGTLNEDGINPWWAVDLRAALYGHSVKFTNLDHNGTYAVFTVSI